MRRRYDHIDLRVRSLAEARPFYETLLPGAVVHMRRPDRTLLQFEAAGVDGATEFFGITESSRHIANECRIAFWADSPSEVDRLAETSSGRALGMSKAACETNWFTITFASISGLSGMWLNETYPP
jgi:predicted enzyme related to lactoylglutathione lyase